MIYVTAVIAALLFVYLGAALVRPEWFDTPLKISSFAGRTRQHSW